MKSFVSNGIATLSKIYLYSAVLLFFQRRESYKIQKEKRKCLDYSKNNMTSNVIEVKKI
jgi:hypothetical protein